MAGGPSKNTALSLQVEDRIEFIVGDMLRVVPEMSGMADVVFLSPPWGGVDYLKVHQRHIQGFYVGSFS